MKKLFRPTARFIVINKKQEILVVLQKHNWAIPWGGIDFWENICDAISRESFEELWIKAECDKFIFVQDFLKNRKGKDMHLFDFFWTIKNNKDFENVENTYKNSEYAYELRDVKWFKLEDFPKDFKPKALKKVLKKYLKDKKNFSCKYISGI